MPEKRKRRASTTLATFDRGLLEDADSEWEYDPSTSAFSLTMWPPDEVESMSPPFRVVITAHEMLDLLSWALAPDGPDPEPEDEEQIYDV